MEGYYESTAKRAWNEPNRSVVRSVCATIRSLFNVDVRPLAFPMDFLEIHAPYVQRTPRSRNVSDASGGRRSSVARTRRKRHPPRTPLRAHPSKGALALCTCREVTQWGYRNQTFDASTPGKLRVYCRPNTTDDKVVDEVLVGHAYQNRTAGMVLEKSDVWLDLGGNIGTFALFALSVGGRCVSVEPEAENAALLRRNLGANFGAAYPSAADGRWRVHEAGVATKSGTMDLHLCNGTYNKYRHTMYTTKRWCTKTNTWRTSAKPREAVAVPVEALSDLLVETHFQGHDINAIKMDIEGMEIALLEALTEPMCRGVRKLVFEYTFDVDPSIPRFLRIVHKLKQWFPTVHYTKVNPNDKEYRHYPPCTMVFCVRPA